MELNHSRNNPIIFIITNATNQIYLIYSWNRFLISLAYKLIKY